MCKEIKRIKQDNSYIIFFRHGENDFSVWFTDDPNDKLQGHNVRGSKLDVIAECEGIVSKDELDTILI